VGRLLDTLLEIVDQDFVHSGAAATEVGTQLEHAHMTKQDQEIITAIFNDIYSKIAALNEAIAALPATAGVSSAQISQMISDAIDALPAFDTSGITWFVAAAPTTTVPGADASTATLADTVAADVTAPTEAPPPAPPAPPSPYITTPSS